MSYQVYIVVLVLLSKNETEIIINTALVARIEALEAENKLMKAKLSNQ